MAMRFPFFRAHRLCMTAGIIAGLASAASAQIQLVIDTLDAKQFPTIRAKVKASIGGMSIRGLSVDQFTVFEDGSIKAPVAGTCEDTTKTGPVSVMLVIDRSGSMGPVFGSNAIVDAKRAAKGFIDRLSSGDEAALISFNDRPSSDQTWTQDKALLKSRIDAIWTGGGTAIWDAIITAVSYLQARANRKVMILLTDGADGSSSAPFTAARDAVRNNGITAYTIGLGSETNPQQLRDIASVSGGRYYSAPDARDLDEIYMAITSEIIPTGICELIYNSDIDCLDGSVHRVEILIAHGGETGRATAEYVVPFDSSTFSYATLAIGESHSVDAGRSVSVPLVLARMTPNRPPTEFECTIQYDRSLLTLDSVSTSELTPGYSVATGSIPGGTALRLSGSVPVGRTGDLAVLHFSSFTRLNSDKCAIVVSPPAVDRPCTVARSRNGIIAVIGVCQQALIRTNPAVVKSRSAVLSVSPNPFNPATNAEYRIAEAGQASLSLRDASGRLLCRFFDRYMPDGIYTQAIEAGDLATGRYYLELKAPDCTDVRPMLLLK